MPGDSIEVRPADLIAHATTIESIAGRLDTAEQAGDAVWMDAAAYGKLCTIVPVLLNGLQAPLVDGIGAAARSLHDTGDRLRTAAGGYQSSDEHAATAHNRIRDAL